MTKCWFFSVFVLYLNFRAEILEVVRTVEIEYDVSDTEVLNGAVLLTPNGQICDSCRRRPSVRHMVISRKLSKADP